MKRAHLIYTPFTSVGLHGGFRGQQWFEHRINIFKNYTFKSLLNQSNRNFIHWISFRPEEEYNPAVKELAEFLQKNNYPFIFTFNGLMYWDDKFTICNLRTRARNLLMMLWDCWHNQERPSLRTLLKNSWENKNATLLTRIRKSIPIVASAIGTDYDWIYLTRIDSDDMFHREAVNLIQSEEPEINKALIFDKGYIYNVQTGQLAEWNPPTNPPFHTIIFFAPIFFHPSAYLSYYKDFKTHEDIERIFNCTILDMHKYMVSFHGKHISTAWESPIIKKAYHLAKYGNTEPFKREMKGYCYTTSGRNISTHWQSRTNKVRNFMIGKEFEGEIKNDILADFGL